MKTAFPVFFLCIVTSLTAQPFGDGFPGGQTCDTSGKFDANTKVTFFGDSRMQLAHSLVPWYGQASMDFYLGAEGWNVQNFGQIAMTSTGLLEKLQGCLNQGDFKIAKNVAFHQGGNDYLMGYIILKFMPWKFQDYSNNALNNIEKIISMFHRRNKNILLIGNFPGVSYSLINGKPEQYAFGQFNPKTYTWTDTSKEEDAVKRKAAMKADLEGWMQRAVAFGPGMPPLASGAPNLDIDSPLGGVLGNGIVGPGNGFMDKIASKLKDGVDKILGKASQGAGFNPYYYWWFFDVSDSLGTVASIGLMQQEASMSEIASRRAAHGTHIQYLRTWEYFARYPNIMAGEAWVANQELFGDIVHINQLGYAVWGNLVGNKIREMQWHTGAGVIEAVTANDTTPVDGENSSRPADTAPNLLDLVIVCYCAGICH